MVGGSVGYCRGIRFREDYVVEVDFRAFDVVVGGNLLRESFVVCNERGRSSSFVAYRMGRGVLVFIRRFASLGVGRR